jgi:pimeloyl-ACP methyl ester carboxylesterase
MLATDLTERVPELALPAYFFHGIYDYTVDYQLAKTYAATLRAPLKGFYTFSESAHSPVLEEPWKAQTILRDDVLACRNTLADSPRRPAA